MTGNGKRFFGRILPIFLGAAIILPAQAKVQPSHPAAPPAAVQPTPAHDTAKAFGDWQVRCFARKSETACDMFQSVQQKSQRILSISLAYSTVRREYATLIIAPFGLSLPRGTIIVADHYRSAPLAFRRCENDGCYVETIIDPSVVASLSSAAKAAINLTAFDGRPIGVPISLNGFNDALAALKSDNH